MERDRWLNNKNAFDIDVKETKAALHVECNDEESL